MHCVQRLSASEALGRPLPAPRQRGGSGLFTPSHVHLGSEQWRAIPHPVPTPSLQVGRGQPESPVCQVARSMLGIPAGQADGLTVQLLTCLLHSFIAQGACAASVHVCVRACVHAYVRGVRAQLWTVVLSFKHLGPGDGLRLPGLPNLAGWDLPPECGQWF